MGWSEEGSADAEPRVRHFADLKLTDLDPISIVELAYLLLLRRPLEPAGRGYWHSAIEQQRFSVDIVIDSILNSPEYFMLRKTPLHEMAHRARLAWCASLDAYDTILDIGGSSPNIDAGALIELGYPHRPKNLVIFDLPEEQQYWGKPRFPQDRDYEFAWGRLHYVHGRAEEIDEVEELRNLKFDCIFMGQVIEHILPEKLPSVIRWIAAHLSERSRFIFDTPNRIVTRVQSPDRYIDSDHKYEYSSDELRRIMVDNNLQVVKQTGLLGMPSTAATQTFNPLEVFEHDLINDMPDSSYLFAFECAKAGSNARPSPRWQQIMRAWGGRGGRVRGIVTRNPLLAVRPA